MGTKLYVGNLSPNTTEAQVQDLFKASCNVVSCILIMDKVTGKSRGFAFVEFATPEEAQKAIEQFHNKEFQGRSITVNVARPREERQERR